MNKSSSNSEIFSRKLQNLSNQCVLAIAKTLDSTTAASFMSILENQKANLFLADVSAGSPVILCNVIPSSPADFACNPISTANSNSILSLSDQFKINPSVDSTPATMTLSPAGTPAANANTISIDSSLTPTINFTQTSYSSNGATATYGLTIDVQMCGSISAGGTSVCQKATVPTNFTFTRSCPNAGKSLDSPGKTMRALTNAEIKTLGGGQYTNTNTFPNLYCTCADPNFVTTTSSGTCLACSGSSPYWNGTSCTTCPTNAVCSNGKVTGCQSGYYYDGSNCTQCQTGIISGAWPSQSCQACPSSSICSNGAISGCQSGYYYDGSNCTQCQTGIISGTWPSQSCQACPSSSICSNGAISGCQSGYYGSNCTQCQTGVISGTWPSQTCQSCPSTAICSNGAINGCQISYYGATCVSKCQGVVSGSWPSATCAACSGSTPYWNGSNCAACPSSTPYWNGTSCAACPSATPYWNGTSCATCPSGTPYWDGSICTTCPAHAVCSNGSITSCSAGYYGSSCSLLCSTGYLTGTGVTAICNSCPATAICSNGTITGCQSKYYGTGCASYCGGTSYLTGSGTTATCNSCPYGSICGFAVLGGGCTGNNPLLANGNCYTCVGIWVYNYHLTSTCMACSSGSVFSNNWYGQPACVINPYSANTNTNASSWP